LLKRYGGNINYILNTKYEDGIKLINSAYEKDLEEKIYYRWIHSECGVSYDEYKQSLIKSVPNKSEKISDKEEKKIMSKTDLIIEQDQKMQSKKKIKLPGRL